MTITPSKLSPVDDGGPAFPMVKQAIGYHADIQKAEEGISVRDYFAAKFLAGAVAVAGGERLDVGPAATEEEIDGAFKEHWANIARVAYIAADALLTARKGGDRP